MKPFNGIILTAASVLLLSFWLCYVRDPFSPPFAGLLRKEMINNRFSFKHGSGFFISSNGYILTAAHVIAGCETVAGLDFSGNSFIINGILTDVHSDIALVLANSNKLHKYITFPHGRLRIEYDSFLYTKGFPWEKPSTLLSHFGDEPLQTITLSHADYSAAEAMVYTSVVERGVKRFQGLSGGPLLTQDGDLLGVASFVRTRDGETKDLAFGSIADFNKRYPEVFSLLGPIVPERNTQEVVNKSMVNIWCKKTH